MATSGYVGEIQPAAQSQGATVTVISGQTDVSSNAATAPQFLAESQTTVATPTVVTPTGQSTPTEQASSIACNCITVTEGSLHSSDSVSDSSPPPAVVQTGVPTQVVQQVQTAQQRSVVQATSQIAKTEPGTQLSFTSLQPVHISQDVQQLTPVPVQHVYSNQVQYVEGGDTNGAENGAGTNGGTAGNYVIQEGYMLRSSSGGAAGNSQYYLHTARASPATVSITEVEESSVPSADKKVQWLLDNYETAEGVSLPRSTVYCHYLLHCQEQKLEPVIASSFGKLIRSVFMGIHTRRLGIRRIREMCLSKG